MQFLLRCKESAFGCGSAVLFWLFNNFKKKFHFFTKIFATRLITFAMPPDAISIALFGKFARLRQCGFVSAFQQLQKKFHFFTKIFADGFLCLFRSGST